jgi:hypothetical protein
VAATNTTITLRFGLEKSLYEYDIDAFFENEGIRRADAAAVAAAAAVAIDALLDITNCTF